jgi:hypothetical protein
VKQVGQPLIVLLVLLAVWRIRFRLLYVSALNSTYLFSLDLTLSQSELTAHKITRIILARDYKTPNYVIFSSVIDAYYRPEHHFLNRLNLCLCFRARVQSNTKCKWNKRPYSTRVTCTQINMYVKSVRGRKSAASPPVLTIFSILMVA